MKGNERETKTCLRQNIFETLNLLILLLSHKGKKTCYYISAFGFVNFTATILYSYVAIIWEPQCVNVTSVVPIFAVTARLSRACAPLRSLFFI